MSAAGGMLSGMSPAAVSSEGVLGVAPGLFPLPLGVSGYAEDAFKALLDEDEDWRGRPHVLADGPLRRADGTFAPVPVYMRLDYRTNRAVPVPEFRPDLGPCWLFRGALVKGYGYIGVGKRLVQAYRLNYERFVGPIPSGAVMDHLCRVRACVHPLHVEPVTYSANTVRSPIHDSAVRAARTQCPEGHLFDEVNTYVTPAGIRQCRACQAAAKRQRTGGDVRVMSTATHCGHGHAWESNLRVLPSGRRQCTACNRLAGQRFRARQQETLAAVSV